MKSRCTLEGTHATRAHARHARTRDPQTRAHAAAHLNIVGCGRGVMPCRAHGAVEGAANTTVEVEHVPHVAHVRVVEHPHDQARGTTALIAAVGLQHSSPRLVTGARIREPTAEAGRCEQATRLVALAFHVMDQRHSVLAVQSTNSWHSAATTKTLIMYEIVNTSAKRTTPLGRPAGTAEPWSWRRRARSARAARW